MTPFFDRRLLPSPVPPSAQPAGGASSICLPAYRGTAAPERSGYSRFCANLWNPPLSKERQAPSHAISEKRYPHRKNTARPALLPAAPGSRAAFGKAAFAASASFSFSPYLCPNRVFCNAGSKISSPTQIPVPDPRGHFQIHFHPFYLASTSPAMPISSSYLVVTSPINAQSSQQTGQHPLCPRKYPGVR